MARQRIAVDPSQKHFEAYNDFSGGMNSEISNERLADSEAHLIENVDLSSRGSLKKRPGMVDAITTSLTGKGQGIFFYYRSKQDEPDIVIASGGKLYLKEFNSSEAKQIIVTNPDGSAFAGFQTDLPIDAAQFKDTMYFATGTKLLQFKGEKDGSGNPTGKVVDPYKPNSMEVVYIGTNALADNPTGFIQDKIDPTLKALGILPNTRTGAVGQNTTMTAYIQRPSDMTVHYKFEYKKPGDTSFTMGQDFGASNSWNLNPEKAGDYEIKVTVRDSANTATTHSFTLPQFTVNLTMNEADRPLDTSNIHTCRLIKLHWDRMILAADKEKPEHFYISDWNNPTYFPTNQTLRFESGRNESITAMLRYRDMLVVFTKTTVQALFGKSPSDYVRRLIHDGIGCVATRSAQIVGNSIMFLSDEGVYELKSVGQVQEYLNVDKLDRGIASQIVIDKEACGVYFDNQYMLCLPSKSEVFRLYPSDGVWTKDKSSKLTFSHMITYGGDLFYQDKNTAKLYKRDKNIFSDAGQAYTMFVRTKQYDLSAQYNWKKVKKLYVLGRHYAHDVNLKFKVFADTTIILDTQKGYVYVAPDGSVTEWREVDNPNVIYPAGTRVGSWVLGVNPLGEVHSSVKELNIRGKCRRLQLEIKHEEPVACEIYGFGVEFKLKKP